MAKSVILYFYAQKNSRPKHFKLPRLRIEHNFSKLPVPAVMKLKFDFVRFSQCIINPVLVIYREISLRLCPKVIISDRAMQCCHYCLAGFPESFPQELIEEIFLKLPIKSLVRSSAVCKSWNSYISSPYFIHTQLNRTIQSNNRNNFHQLLLEGLLSSTKIFLLQPADNSSFDVDKKLTVPFSSPLQNLSVVGTCNGLVCLANYALGAVVIWNPVLRKYLILPNNKVSSSGGFVRYAFGYDSLTNDYKVLRIVVYDQKPSHVEVWSLARGSWTSLKPAIVPLDFKPRVCNYVRYPFVNGALHWVGLRIGVIVTFDMSNEIFGEIKLPGAVTRDVENIFVSRYRQSLAVLRKSDENSIDIWVMKEYGSAESWIELSTLPSGTRPIWFRESVDELVLQRNGVGLQSVDLKNKTANKLPDNIYLYSMNSFTESLALLGNSNAVSY